MRRSPLLVLLPALLLSACARQSASVLPTPSSDLKGEVEFRGYLAMDFPMQDVFIETGKGSPQVTRFEVRPTVDLSQMAKTFAQVVYGSEEAQPHDPLKTQSGALGPFAKGVRIGTILQMWDSARGEGMYKVNGGTATLTADFHGLMKGGTYSLWCSKISRNAVVEWPCVKPGEPGNPLKADPKGRAELEVSFPALPDTTTETGAYISLAYHSDHHQTALANDFGKHTHVQVLTKIPSPASLRPAW